MSPGSNPVRTGERRKPLGQADIQEVLVNAILTVHDEEIAGVLCQLTCITAAGITARVLRPVLVAENSHKMIKI